ncbi:MAG: helix-turn-helix domain-containing protein [Candidatus Omnitrophica bacterium]|nr:helix-turn-helix domain-containing protein [Candidatus Omnitrophota bacterium]
MAEEKLLTVREVSLILGISEREVIELAESGKIPAYKIGGVYLRFKPSQIKEVADSFKKASINSSLHRQRNSFKDSIIDFFYFNDFYIISFIIIFLILYLIFKG